MGSTSTKAGGSMGAVYDYGFERCLFGSGSFPLPSYSHAYESPVQGYNSVGPLGGLEVNAQC